VIKNHKSYTVELLKAHPDEKNFFIKVNGKKFKFAVKDKYDELLKSLGMDNLTTTKVANLKAPMPGLVINIDVEVGQTVQKGDALLILEAMKMENVIKSPTDGIIKNILVKKGDAVEKNQVLLNF
jgi:biotin carboxyl carrier protein